MDFPEAAEKIIAANSQVTNNHHSQVSYSQTENDRGELVGIKKSRILRERKMVLYSQTGNDGVEVAYSVLAGLDQ